MFGLKGLRKRVQELESRMRAHEEAGRGFAGDWCAVRGHYRPLAELQSCPVLDIGNWFCRRVCVGCIPGSRFDRRRQAEEAKA